MESLKINLANFNTDVDVTHKLNTNELYNWLNHLNHLKKELKDLIILCSKNDNELLLKFKKKNEENDNLISVLNRYKVIRENIVECDDTKCDMFFITEHESYRRTYLYHLEKYRKVKDLFYISIKGKMDRYSKKLSQKKI